jgi:hypothetical protein
MLGIFNLDYPGASTIFQLACKKIVVRIIIIKKIC